MDFRKACIAGVGIVGLTLATVFTSSALADQRGRDRGGDGASEGGVKIGDKAPDFTLRDFDGKEWTLSKLTEEGKIVVLEWFNPGCPYVIKHHARGQSTMRDLAKDYEGKDVVWLAINSTNERHADFKKSEPMATEWGIKYPVLTDASGEVGKAYGARTTPHMFIIDKDGKVRYQGAIDSHRKGRAPADDEKSSITNYVAQALDQVIAGETVTTPTTDPYGCGVKYAR